MPFLWHLSLGVGSLKSCQSRYAFQPLVLFGVRTERALSHGSSVPCSVPQLALEEPIETAILLSLVGVKSILANQWPTTLQDNALRANVLWESAWCRPVPHPEPPWKPAVEVGGDGGAGRRVHVSEVEFLPQICWHLARQPGKWPGSFRGWKPVKWSATVTRLSASRPHLHARTASCKPAHSRPGLWAPQGKLRPLDLLICL